MDLQINPDNAKDDNQKSQSPDQQRFPSIANPITKVDMDPTV